MSASSGSKRDEREIIAILTFSTSRTVDLEVSS